VTIARSMLVAAALAMLPSALFTSSLDAAQHESHGAGSPAALVQAVRQATEPFRDARNVPEGYGAVLGCVSGPEVGAMGVHFVNAELLLNGELKPDQPEALIYEFRNGAAICFSSWTARTVSASRPITNFTSGRGGTTRTAHSSIGTPASPVKGNDGHVDPCSGQRSDL